MKKVLILVPCRDRHKKLLQTNFHDEYQFDYVENGDATQEQLVKANIIIGEPTLEQLQKAERLEWLQMSWAGTDRYTRNNGFPKGVMLTNATGIYGGIISEYVLGGILSVYRNLGIYHDNQKRKLWQDYGKERLLQEKRALIVGAGDIGANVARKLQAFDAVTIGIRRHESREKETYFSEMHSIQELDNQLPLADIVILALPSTPLTDGMMNLSRIMSMKKDALLVNVGRGSVVVTKDLEHAMLDGQLYGAVLDVCDPEPLPDHSPLWNMDHVLITPHISGPTWNHVPEIEDKVYDLCIENLRHYMEGKELMNLVNFKLGY